MQRLLDDFIESTPWKQACPCIFWTAQILTIHTIEYILVHITISPNSISLTLFLYVSLSLCLCVYIPLHNELIKIYLLFEMPIEITNLFAIPIKCTNTKDFQWISKTNTNTNNTRTRPKNRFIFHQREVHRCNVSLTLTLITTSFGMAHSGQTLN